MTDFIAPEILKHLIEQEGYDAFLQKAFPDEDDYKAVKRSIIKEHRVPDHFINDYENAFLEDFLNYGEEIFEYSWDSNGWGPMGNGFYSIHWRWGLVLTRSSDLDEEFGFTLRDNWHPFPEDPNYIPTGAIESMEDDVVNIQAGRFKVDDLIELALSRGIETTADLTVNYEEVNWDEYFASRRKKNENS